jgi:hypothetical protein
LRRGERLEEEEEEEERRQETDRDPERSVTSSYHVTFPYTSAVQLRSNHPGNPMPLEFVFLFFSFFDKENLFFFEVA